MIVVRPWTLSFADDGRDGTHPGYAHCGLVDRSVGATHTDLGLCRLAPGAVTPRHVHSFEQCAYVLGGEPAIEIAGSRHQLVAGDFVLFPVGTPHAWWNPATSEAHWLEVGTPLAATGQPDTFFLPGSLDARRPERPTAGDPTLRGIGHYPGTASQSEALAIRDPARGRAPAGMDTALLAYSGISVKMMVDGGLGASLLTMFMVDYEPGGAAQAHDHPFEEAYFFLEGEIEGEVDGELRTFRAGEVLFCGVGVVHGFFNTAGGHVRWIETQAPQPPRRHSYRWPAQWERMASGEGVTLPGTAP
jgi:quercetin dioxygenase-like cupin family protein